MKILSCVSVVVPDFHKVTVVPVVSRLLHRAIANTSNRSAIRSCEIGAPMCPDYLSDGMKSSQVVPRADAGKLDWVFQQRLVQTFAILIKKIKDSNNGKTKNKK